jgi:thiosulfate dehydrogenase
MMKRALLTVSLTLAACGMAWGLGPTWSVPSVDSLPDNAWGRMVRQGRDLTLHTPELIGPDAADPAQRYAVSTLSCSNCHLEAGAKRFGLPFVGVFADFPEYRAREGEVGTLEDRINGCMTRSQDGKPLPLDSPAMTAMVSYMKFLSTGVPIGASMPGRGSGTMPLLSRAADPVHGKQVYAERCAACHGAGGQGLLVGGKAIFPPLWGPGSFNDGAGMDRLIDAANFIHSNMPNGASWDKPVLSEEDSWDVAAFMLAQPRPHKAGLEKDYPVLREKPVDTPYGPYADAFSQTQHRLGPYGPMLAKP